MGKRLFRWLLGGMALLLIGTVLQVAAQTDADQGWSIPVNISQTGAATMPVLFKDAADGWHVIWQDNFAGFVYSRSEDGRAWDPPGQLTLPFSDPPFITPASQQFNFLFTPLLVADENGSLHGFWTNDTNQLWHSQAALADLANPAAWSPSVQLAESATAFDVALSGDGRLHLGYVRQIDTAEFPAGIYYRTSPDGGASWSEAFSLYHSPYFRTTTSAQAHIVMTAEGENVYAAWDNRLLDTVFVARSADGGGTWAEPVVVDRRGEEDPPGAPGPTQIEVLADGGEVHLTWQAQHEESCTQFHQRSVDEGRTWEAVQPAFLDARDCPASGQLYLSSEGILFLVTMIRSEVNLQAWDGANWSQPVPQSLLNRFTDPETYRPVQFDCRQPEMTDDNRLLVAGCGTGNDSDIWAMARPLGELADWSDRFLPTPAWSMPVQVAASSLDLLPPHLVAGPDGRLHAFWSQTTRALDLGQIEVQGSGAGEEIYYSRLEGDRWAAARPILSSPAGGASQVSVAAASPDTLYAVWSSGETGGIYFSRANADQASSVTEWIEPHLLPAKQPSGSWPDIVVGSDGAIYIAYALPFNEDRGIYLTKSTDDGDSWSQPVLVFDGAAAGWTAVGRPRLAVTGLSDLHLMWTQDSPPPDGLAQRLVYSRSGDGGQNWSDLEDVQDGVVLWQDLSGVGERILQRVWQTQADSGPDLWQQHSLDSGLTWSDPVRLAAPALTGGPAALVVDGANEPHLVQLAADSNSHLFLQEWVWDGGRWLAGDRLDLGSNTLESNAISAVTAMDGRFGVIYAALLQDASTGQIQENLFYTGRLWETPAALPTPLPSLTPTPQPVATMTPTPPQPSPTPTAVLPSVGQGSGLAVGPLNANNPTGRVLFGVLPAILILGIVLAVAIRLMRSRS